MLLGYYFYTNSSERRHPSAEAFKENKLVSNPHRNVQFSMIKGNSGSDYLKSFKSSKNCFLANTIDVEAMASFTTILELT